MRITIDGPTASGKSTLAVALAGMLKLAFLDTGLTFRALSYALSRLPLQPTDAWQEIIEHQPVSGSAEPAVLFQGEDVTNEIFSPVLEPSLAAIAADPEWRTQIRQSQKRLIDGHSRIVVVGRDTAVALMPRATLHVALTANLVIRRERRRAQYRDLPGRSSAVGPATARDGETAAAVRGRPNSLVLDTSYLPAAAVQRAAVRRLDS
jgi:cytidylate kinase